jgi:CheY-like chemotaxis protein
MEDRHVSRGLSCYAARTVSPLFRVAILGFSAFERNALAAYLRLATNRAPRYVHEPVLSEADLLVADADHAPSVELVSAIDRLSDTVFIGAHPPPSVWTCLGRPIEPLDVMRELDALAAVRQASPPRGREPGRTRTVIQPPRRAPAPPPPAAADLPTIDLRLRVDPQNLRPATEEAAPAGSAGPDTPSADDMVERPGPLAAALTALAGSPVPVAPVDQSAMPWPPLPPSVAAPAEPASQPATPFTPPTPPAAPMPADPDAARAKHSPAAPTLLSDPALPAAAGPPAARRAASPRGPTPARRAVRAAPAAPPAPPMRALVVDDSEIAQRFLQLRLERYGLLIDCATGSEPALSLLTRHSYDFAFLDMELGEASRLDGLALCQAVRRHYATRVPPVTVVLVTAHTGELDRVRGMLAGCDALLGKPLDETQLDRLLGRHGLVRRAEAPSP